MHEKNFLDLSELRAKFKLMKKKQMNQLHLLLKKKKRETGFEPATLALARRYSTTEPLAHISYNIQL